MRRSAIRLTDLVEAVQKAAESVGFGRDTSLKKLERVLSRIETAKATLEVCRRLRKIKKLFSDALTSILESSASDDSLRLLFAAESLGQSATEIEWRVDQLWYYSAVWPESERVKEFLSLIEQYWEEAEKRGEELREEIKKSPEKAFQVGASAAMWAKTVIETIERSLRKIDEQGIRRQLKLLEEKEKELLEEAMNELAEVRAKNAGTRKVL